MVKSIALTGGIASGKSLVAKHLQAFGYCVWDADVFAKEVLQQPEVLQELQSWGPQFFSKGELDRKALRQFVFHHPEEKQYLEDLLHPKIQTMFEARLAQIHSLAPSAWVFYEAALILEKKRQTHFDACVLVTAPLEQRLERLARTRNYTLEESQQAIRNQWVDELKMPFADYVVHSDSTSKIDIEVHKMLEFLRKKFAH